MSTDSRANGVLLVNLGSPDAATASAVADWLIEFLSDPDVVDLPRWFWRPLLKRIIAPKRAQQLAKLYTQIWTDQGSPLVAISQRQAVALERELTNRGYSVLVTTGMRYGSPNLLDALHYLRSNTNQMQILLQYPQFAQSTSGSAIRVLNSTGPTPPPIIDSYALDSSYIEALAQSITNYWQTSGRGDHLLISFHGLPERTIRRGDPYQLQCEQTTAALVKHLNLQSADYTLCYQSRFGAARWIGPATVDVVADKAAAQIGRLDVVCPGFAADCLETLEEINVQLRQRFIADGGKSFHYIPALNDSPRWIKAMADMLEPGLQEQ